MVLTLAFLILGAAILYLGAEGAVRGAAGLSRALGIPAFTLGALLFGVDVEGLGAALVASGRGETELAAGEAYGTVLFLFGLALGLALVLSPRPVASPSPLMVSLPAVPVMASALAISDRFVARDEGVLLVLVYGGYVALVLLRGRERPAEAPEGPTGEPGAPAEATEEESADRPSRDRPVRPAPRPLALAALAVLGLLFLYGGATLLVAGGARLARLTGLSSGFVGGAVLGILVSLDEVLLEVLPIRRGQPELATGNLFGTLAAFTAGVLGLAAMVRPLFLDSAAVLAFLAAALLYAVVGTAFLARGRAGRGLGVAVLVLYAAWLAYASTV